MNQQSVDAAPESTAVRVALWRALHVQLDQSPHVLEDEIGLKLVAPDADWRQRPDMEPRFTAGFRAAIVARARFTEDLVSEEADRGMRQYVILGAGLDTFAQRRPEVASRLHVFEVDQPGPQAWKRQRLVELGFGVPDWLRLVPVDFEAGASLWDDLVRAGFDRAQPALVASAGVTQYITREATAATFRQVASLAPGSKLLTTFMLPMELTRSEDQGGYEASRAGAQASGTPFISFYTPEQITALARETGFRETRIVTTEGLIARYFANRSDGLRPSSGEPIMVATV
jgi:methyltransferase (TIGR00027 family)